MARAVLRRYRGAAPVAVPTAAPGGTEGGTQGGTDNGRVGVSVPCAARVLGISERAVRKRIGTRTLDADQAHPGGPWTVYLPAGAVPPGEGGGTGGGTTGGGGRY